MFARSIKNNFFVHKIALIGFIFALLAVIFLCGHISIIGNVMADGITECKTAFFGNSINMKDSIMLSLLLFSFIALGVLLKNDIRLYPTYDTSVAPSRIFLKITQLINKLNNPILKAFRIGILHPQIYSFAQISS